MEDKNITMQAVTNPLRIELSSGQKQNKNTEQTLNKGQQWEKAQQDEKEKQEKTKKDEIENKTKQKELIKQENLEGKVKAAKETLNLDAEVEELLEEAQGNQKINKAFLSKTKSPERDYIEGPRSSTASTTTPSESRSSSSTIEVKSSIGKFAKTLSLSIQSSEAKKLLENIIQSEQTNFEQLHTELKELKSNKKISPEEFEILESVIEIQSLQTTIHQIIAKGSTLFLISQSEEILKKASAIEQKLTLLLTEKKVAKKPIKALRNVVILEKNKIYALSSLQEACEQLCLQEPKINASMRTQDTLLTLLEKQKERLTEKAELNRIESEKKEIDGNMFWYITKKLESKQKSAFDEVILERLQEGKFLIEPIDLPDKVKERLSFLKDLPPPGNPLRNPATRLFANFQEKSLKALLVDLGQIQAAMAQIEDAKTFRFFSKTLLPALMNFIICQMTPDNLAELAVQCMDKNVDELAVIQKALGLLSLPAHVRPGLENQFKNFSTQFSVLVTTKIKTYSDLLGFSTPDIDQQFSDVDRVSTHLLWDKFPKHSSQDILPSAEDLNQIKNEDLLQLAEDQNTNFQLRLNYWYEVLRRSSKENLILFAEALSQTAALNLNHKEGDAIDGLYLSIELARYTAVMVEPINCRIQFIEAEIEKYQAIQVKHPDEHAFEEKIKNLTAEMESWNKLREIIHEQIMPSMHPITQIIASYASAALQNQARFLFYSDIFQLNKKFSENMEHQCSNPLLSKRIWLYKILVEDFNKYIIQPELNRTILLPDLILGKKKYVPTADNEHHLSIDFLKMLEISFQQFEEGIKREIRSTKEKIQQIENKLPQKERDLKEKSEKLQKLDIMTKRCEQSIRELSSSPNKNTQDIHDFKKKKQLERSHLEAEIVSGSDDIQAIKNDFQSSTAFYKSLCDLLPKPESDSTFISPDMFIVWVQSEASSKYLQGSFMKYMMEQIQYQKNSSDALNHFLNQMKNFPDFPKLISRYIQCIESVLNSLVKKNAEDPRISVLQTAAKGLKQFQGQAQKTLKETEKLATLTKQPFGHDCYSPITQILRGTLEKRLTQLAERVFPSPEAIASAPGPVASASTPAMQHSGVQNMRGQGFWGSFSFKRQGQSNLQSLNAVPEKNSSTRSISHSH